MEFVMNTEFPSVRYPTALRRLISAIGGPRGADENRKSWLWKVATRSGVNFRMVCAAYYGEPVSVATREKLQKAAERDEPTNQAAALDGLAEQLRAKDPEFYGAQIDQLRALARQFRGENSAGG